MNYFEAQKFNDSNDFVSESGDRFHEDFVGKLDKDGNVRLVSVGKTDVYEEIQSHALEADINVLLKRAFAGDTSVFTSAVFGDFSDRPTEFYEMLNMVRDAEREFNSLPIELKDKFENSFEKYIASAGSKEWFSKLAGKDFKEFDEKDSAASVDHDGSEVK